MIVTDPDSKFNEEFEGVCKLVQIPHHKSARGNHNAIIIERFIKFLNSGMKIFTSERSTKRVFIEGAKTLCYAWNSAPCTGTDLSRSLLVVGREFKFPIYIEMQKHTMYNINETTIKTYAEKLTDLLVKSREVFINY